MSTTWSTAKMVSVLQTKTAIGMPNLECMDLLNEAFRKLNQISKGGFMWQVVAGSLVVPAGTQVVIPLPPDFDPGKTAILKGTATFGGTATVIPYLPFKNFGNEEHFRSIGPDMFSSWTVVPYTPNPIAWGALLGPLAAYPTTGGTFGLIYHAVSYQPLLEGGGIYFPTPDQFDSLIVDLAIAEARNIYRMSGEEGEIQKAMAAIADIIDTYRTDRYDLAGVTDQLSQAQERQFEKAK